MQRSLLRSMLSFSSGTFVSRVLGLVREIVIASVFGANVATDAFLIAFRIPNFMRRLFAEGSFSMAFVPVLTEYKERRDHAAMKELVARTAGTLGAALLIVTALGMIFANVVVGGFAPGSINEPAKFTLTTDLLRLTFPFLLFVSLTALSGGVLNSFNKFGLAALTPVILNLCMIAGAWWGSWRCRSWRWAGLSLPPVSCSYWCSCRPCASLICWSGRAGVGRTLACGGFSN